MGPAITALIRDTLDDGAERFAGKALLVAAPVVLGAAAAMFLAVAGYGAVYEAFGPRAAALSFAALFAVLALAALLMGRIRSSRRRRRAAEARARLAGEVSALRMLAAASGAFAPLAALASGFALSRRS